MLTLVALRTTVSRRARRMRCLIRSDTAAISAAWQRCLGSGTSAPFEPFVSLGGERGQPNLVERYQTGGLNATARRSTMFSAVLLVWPGPAANAQSSTDDSETRQDQMQQRAEAGRFGRYDADDDDERGGWRPPRYPERDPRRWELTAEECCKKVGLVWRTKGSATGIRNTEVSPSAEHAAPG